MVVIKYVRQTNKDPVPLSDFSTLSGSVSIPAYNTYVEIVPDSPSSSIPHSYSIRVESCELPGATITPSTGSYHIVISGYSVLYFLDSNGNPVFSVHDKNTSNALSNIDTLYIHPASKITFDFS